MSSVGFYQGGRECRQAIQTEGTCSRSIEDELEFFQSSVVVPYVMHPRSQLDIQASSCYMMGKSSWKCIQSTFSYTEYAYAVHHGRV